MPVSQLSAPLGNILRQLIRLCNAPVGRGRKEQERCGVTRVCCCLVTCFLPLFDTVHRLFVCFLRYATSYDGVLIVDDSSLIHDFYTGECARPVHLVLDTALKVTDVDDYRASVPCSFCCSSRFAPLYAPPRYNHHGRILPLSCCCMPAFNLNGLS